MKNPNHPLPGQVIRVEPIRSLQAIDKIKRSLSDSPRDLAIFVFGVNTNVRAIDLLTLTVGQVRSLNVGDHFVLREKKTGKIRRITINHSVFNALQRWLSIYAPTDATACLFPSKKTGRPLKVPTLNNMVKSWCLRAGLQGNYGSHSLRKTFGFIHRTVHQTDIATLMVMFNHSNQGQTLDYLGIQPSEVKEAYLKEI